MDPQNLSKLPSKFKLQAFDRFHISRVLGNVALVNVGVVRDLASANALMRRTALQIPGAYLVFSERTRRVVSKLVSSAPNPDGGARSRFFNEPSRAGQPNRMPSNRVRRG
jgi:hypothetical protein